MSALQRQEMDRLQCNTVFNEAASDNANKRVVSSGSLPTGKMLTAAARPSARYQRFPKHKHNNNSTNSSARSTSAAPKTTPPSRSRVSYNTSHSRSGADDGRTQPKAPSS